MKYEWTGDDMADQTGKIFLVTGANDGLGLRTTRELVKKNATVVMACRNPVKAGEARASVLSEYPGARLDGIDLDLGDLGSVRRAAESVLSRYARLDGILCNAGIMAVPFGKTKDGFESHMGVNHLGHFALVGLLLPLVRKSPGIRIVTTSSLAEKFGKLELEKGWREDNYKRYFAYGDSKLAILIFALSLNELFRKNGIHAYALSAHPGIARSNLRNERLRFEKSAWQRFQLKLYEGMAVPIEIGAYPILYAATSPEVKGGEYIGLSGAFERSGYPKVTKGQRRAYDSALREKLWKYSEDSTGVKYGL